jgi:uncharacterized protein YuzE
MKYTAVIALLTCTPVNGWWSRYRMTDEEREAYYEARWLAHWDTDENGTVEEAEVEVKYLVKCVAYQAEMNEFHRATALTDEEVTAECDTLWDAWWLAADTDDGAGGDPDGLLSKAEYDALEDSVYSEFSHSSSEHDDMIAADEMLVSLDTDEDGEVTAVELSATYATKCDDYYTNVNAYYETAPLDQDGIDAACVAAWDILWAAVDTSDGAGGDPDDVLDRDELMAWGTDKLFCEWEDCASSDWGWGWSSSSGSNYSAGDEETSAIDYLMHFDIDETPGVVEAEIETPYMEKCETDMARSNYWNNVEMTDEEVTAACALEWTAWWATIDTEADGDLSVEELEAYFLAMNDHNVWGRRRW